MDKKINKILAIITTDNRQSTPKTPSIDDFPNLPLQSEELMDEWMAELHQEEKFASAVSLIIESKAP
jgi:small nuclear ribonucleoprotein (snRNP)-like protein